MRKVLCFLSCFVAIQQLGAQTIGIGTVTPDPSSMLEIKALNKGLLIPRMTTATLGTISNPAKGLLVLDTLLNMMMMNTGTASSPVWAAVGGTPSGGWLTWGNNVTAAHYFGTNNTLPLIFKTNSAERARLTQEGYLGLNTNAPAATLDIQATSTPLIPQLQLKEAGADNFSRMRFSNMVLPARFWDIGAQTNSLGIASDNLRFYHTSAGNVLTLMGSGKVGIGTTDPRGTLEVKNPGLSTLYISSTNLVDSSKLIFSNTIGNTTGTNIVLTSRSEAGLIFSSQSDVPENNNASLLHITPGGNVGIGISNPTRLLQIGGTTEIRNGGFLSMFNSSGSVRMQVTPEENAGEGVQMSLYNGNNVMTVDIDADYGVNRRGRIILDEIQIKGGSDFAEEFTVHTTGTDLAIPGMLLSIDPDREGQLTIANQPYDHKIAGVVSGANGVAAGMLMGHTGTIASGDVPVALAGRVYVLATEEGGIILPGDMITSSSTKGYAMKASDPRKAYGTVIGKAMSRRDPETGFVLVLINLQ